MRPVQDSLPRPAGWTALAALAAVTLAWLVWLVSSAGAGHTPSSASIPHAPNSPFGWTTLAGAFGALAAAAAAAAARARELAGINPDAPFMYPETLWTERQLKRISDWMREADSILGTLGRAAVGAALIAALGIAFHGENGLRAWGEPFVAWGRNR